MSEISKLHAGTVALAVRQDVNLPGLVRYWEQIPGSRLTFQDWTVEETPNVVYLDYQCGNMEGLNWRYRVFDNRISTSIIPAVARFGVVGLEGYGNPGTRETRRIMGHLVFDKDCWEGHASNFAPLEDS